MDRKEAIEVVKENYPHVATSGSALETALRELVPELAESEDERIRKMLVEQMEGWKKCAEDNNVEQDVKDASAALAWLEKQKEQVADESDKIATAYQLGLADGRKEQKPAEWSEEDESNLQSCIAKIEIDMQRWDNHGKTMVDGDIKLIDWLKAIPERIKSIRPQSNNNLRWRRAKAGENLPESIIMPDGDDPRFGKCAVKDSYYIPIEELKNLPKDES